MLASPSFVFCAATHYRDAARISGLKLKADYSADAFVLNTATTMSNVDLAGKSSPFPSSLSFQCRGLSRIYLACLGLSDRPRTWAMRGPLPTVNMAHTYYYNAGTYSHGAYLLGGAVGLTTAGALSSTQFGLAYSESDLKLSSTM